jgi:formamidopyrimidine-DNA glycosylase
LSKKINEEKQWPPRFWKLKMQLSPSPQDCPTDDDIQWAFTDPRRLGRIRLVEDPLSQPPISNLGFDPIVSMPDLKIFSELIRQRRTTIKALLLDQKFSAGVGNWVADGKCLAMNVRQIYD